MIDIYLRCETRARWQALAVARGLMTVQTIGGLPLYSPVEGVSIDEIGFYEVTPAVIAANGTVTTPAVFDTWWSVNVRLTGAAAAADEDDLYTGETDAPWKFLRSKLVRFVRAQGTQVTLMGMRAYRFGTTPNRVDVIDSRDLTPKRVWLGGMSY